MYVTMCHSQLNSRTVTDVAPPLSLLRVLPIVGIRTEAGKTKKAVFSDNKEGYIGLF